MVIYISVHSTDGETALALCGHGRDKDGLVWAWGSGECGEGCGVTSVLYGNVSV